MTDFSEQKKERKRDFLLLTGLLLFGIVLWLLFRVFSQSGNTAAVTVDGAPIGRWSLAENREFRVDGIGGSNLVQIANGAVNVIDADCPDRICVHHLPISHAGERIVCLPHRVIVSIESTEASEVPDAVSQ